MLGFHERSLSDIMMIDMLGKKRYKVNLHTHTTRSDGRKTPEEVLELYHSKGYDAVALTDHWVFGAETAYKGMTVISGAEYDNNTYGETVLRDSLPGLYHVVCVGAKEAPAIGEGFSPQQMIDEIHKVGGTAILAHPAWSLNTPEQILALRNIDATEIYNSASAVHNSRRPDSSLIIDMIATRGLILPLVASDDTHYYDGEDDCISWSMVEAENNSPAAILEAVRNGKCYTTQGPEVHLTREGDELVLRCSPAVDVVFLSNFVWSRRGFTGDNLTEVRYKPMQGETFVRAQIIDADGKHAWTNIIPIE